MPRPGPPSADGGPPPFSFNHKVCKELAASVQRPIIFALSREDCGGTPSVGGELTAAEAYAWTEGRCFFADRSTQDDEIQLPNGESRHVRGMQTVQVFPGIAMGSLMSRSTRLREDM